MSDINKVINFNVPGKPNPPPVNLTLTFWSMARPKPSEFSFAAKCCRAILQAQKNSNFSSWSSSHKLCK